jgi:peroxin-5
MKQLRDREVVIEGNQMVPRDEATTLGTGGWASDFQVSAGADVKGKGRAVEVLEHPITSSMMPGGSSILAQPTISSSEQRTNSEDVRESLLSAEEEIDEYFRQENDAYIGYWHGSTPPQSMTPRENAEWGRLQHDWDRFEATATGIRPVANYQFQSNNPYVLGEASTRHHMLHAQGRNTLYDVCLILIKFGFLQYSDTNRMRCDRTCYKWRRRCSELR